MKAPRYLHTLTVVTRPEHDDLVAAVLERLSARSSSIYTDARTGRSRVTVHLDTRHAAARSCRQFTEELSGLRSSGVPVTRRSVRLGRLRNTDWAESWKRHFKAIEVGAALLIRPDWVRRRPRPGQRVVILNPGLSFGTGQHATTAFCLAELMKARRQGQKQSMLDIGTGSGILAIAAAKLGFDGVEAVDVDPQSIRVARGNAARNRVTDRIRIERRDLLQLGLRARRRYDVVCANLTSDLLVGCAPAVCAQVASGGRLVLAGILRNQFAAVAAAYMRLGFQVKSARTQNEWRSGMLLRPAG